MNRRQFLSVAGAAATTLVAGACSSFPSGPSGTSGTSGPGSSGSSAPDGSPHTIASGLNVPWSIVFLPDRSALVSQRDDARISQITPDGRVLTVGDVADVAPRGEGGLQGLAVAPDDPRTVFAYYTTDDDNRVVRMDFDGARLGAPRPIMTGLDTAFNHHGGAMLFDRDGSLFVAVGDAAQPKVAQDVRARNGKILRITRDGRPAPGNPFGNEVWSYGHRNVEGLAFDRAGRLWATEFGQNDRDELNLIGRGGNYGWPEVEGESDDPRWIAPVTTWSTGEASPAGLAIVGDRAYVAALRGRRLWEVPLRGESAGAPVARFTDEYGRIRAVAAAPDGSLWMGTSNTDGRGLPGDGDDRILRVTVA